MYKRLSGGIIVALVACILFVPLAQAKAAELQMWNLVNLELNQVNQEVIDRFEAMNPDIKITLNSEENDPYKTKLQILVASSDPPDIFFNWTGADTGVFVRAGRLMNLKEAMEQENNWEGDKKWKDSFMPFAIDAATYGEGIYNVPHRVLAKFFFYNKEVYAKYALTAPDTWDEFIDVLNKVKGTGLYPIAFGNKDKWPGCHYMTILTQKFVGLEQYNNDGYLRGEKEKLFTDPGYVYALETLLSLKENGYFNPGINALEMEVARSLLFSKAAHYYGGHWNFAYYDGRAGEIPEGFEFGFFNLPKITTPEAKGNQDVVWGLAEGFNVSSETEYPDEAVKFLRYLTSVEVQKEFLKRAGSFSSVIGALAEDPVFSQAAERLESAPGVALIIDAFYEPRVSDEYLTVLQSVIDESMSPEEAMGRVSTVAQRVREEIGEIVY